LKKKVVLVGASTGGPSQIKELMCCINSISCTIIIIQHMKEDVLPFFIKDIQDTLNIDVKATPLELDFTSSSIIICSHTSKIEKNGFVYSIKTDRENEYYTPDINKFFTSFSNYSSDFDVDVVILTGIGADGVDGAKKLKLNGATIYAQDEKTSPVYGMPKAAYESGIVDKVMSIDEMKRYFKAL